MSSDLRTSAIVVTLTPAPNAARELIDWLERDSRVAAGPLNGDRLPLSFQCEGRPEERSFWEALTTHPSVGMANLIFVHEDVK